MTLNFVDTLFALTFLSLSTSMLKHGTKVNILLNETTWFLFEVTVIGNSILISCEIL